MAAQVTDLDHFIKSFKELLGAPHGPRREHEDSTGHVVLGHQLLLQDAIGDEAGMPRDSAPKGLSRETGPLQ